MLCVEFLRNRFFKIDVLINDNELYHSEATTCNSSLPPDKHYYMKYCGKLLFKPLYIAATDYSFDSS